MEESGDESVHALRTRIFSRRWAVDEEIRATAATLPSHDFLSNPSGQYAYVYLTQFVKALCEARTGRGFGELKVLDWGCGKGHVTKMLRDLGPGSIDSCDLLSESEDSAFGQETPIIQHFGIKVKPLEHESELPYDDQAFDAVLSVGVLEHVPNDRASLKEIRRVLRPGGLFFCFYLPTEKSWTQKVAHGRGNFYHDRLYGKSAVQEMLQEAGLDVLDMWYRQLLPKNKVRYPNFRMFERFDQLMTEHTPLRRYATNLEFVAQRPI